MKQTVDRLPGLVPGTGSPRPVSNSGCIKRVLKEYKLVHLDQRGTGLSTPITAQTMRDFSSSRSITFLPSRERRNAQAQTDEPGAYHQHIRCSLRHC